MRTNADILEQDPEQDKLTDQQWTAISCLLDGKTLQATADTCGVNARTLRRWLHSPDFSKEYTKARRQHFDNVAAGLQSAAQDAAETLTRLLKCGDPVVELRAAKAILQISKESLATAEIQHRLDDLEAITFEQSQKIEKLEEENIALKQYRDNYTEMMQTLVQGTFQRPKLVTTSAWDKIIRSNAQTVAT